MLTQMIRRGEELVAHAHRGERLGLSPTARASTVTRRLILDGQRRQLRNVGR